LEGGELRGKPPSRVSPSNLMKILILGARGNLGSQLTEAYANEDGMEIFGWDKNEVDITDSPSLLAKITELKPEIIINAAAYNAVDKCEASEGEFLIAKKINSKAVGVMAEAAKKINATLVHYSTDYVFAGDKIESYDEIAEPSPINNYGQSKLSGEKEILSRSNLKYYLIRTSKLFGPKGPSEAAKPSFFDIMLKVAKEKNEIRVVNEEKSCFTYTPDLAAATKKLIDDKRPFGVYHIINPGPATWFESCVELFKIADINKKIIPVSGNEFPRPAKRPISSVLLNTKLPPLRNYQEALKEYFKKIH
jgi:dTDP-4-dehydrorhamnose reductase